MNARDLGHGPDEFESPDWPYPDEDLDPDGFTVYLDDGESDDWQS